LNTIKASTTSRKMLKKNCRGIKTGSTVLGKKSKGSIIKKMK
jgi:hypothetical protein